MGPNVVTCAVRKGGDEKSLLQHSDPFSGLSRPIWSLALMIKPCFGDFCLNSEIKFYVSTYLADCCTLLAFLHLVFGWYMYVMLGLSILQSFIPYPQLIGYCRLGMTSLKKECLLSGIVRIRGGGGEALARKFWPSFHQVLIPKISQYLLKSHNICMFFWYFLSWIS